MKIVGQATPPEIHLERNADDPSIASGHQWAGVATQNDAHPLARSYTLEPQAYDRAGNPWASTPIEAFEVDIGPPVLNAISISGTAAQDGYPPIHDISEAGSQDYRAGLFDRIRVNLSVEGEPGETWDPRFRA